MYLQELHHQWNNHTFCSNHNECVQYVLASRLGKRVWISQPNVNSFEFDFIVWILSNPQNVIIAISMFMMPI